MGWGHFLQWQESSCGKQVASWNVLKVLLCPSTAQCCQVCRDFAVQHWCLGHWLCWHKRGNCMRSSALKENEVPTAWLVEEILRALVVTRAVGASKIWGETHMLRAHLSARGQLPYMSQPLPSLCYLLQQILVVLNKCRFYNAWGLKQRSGGWTFKILLFELPR